jgi:TonB-dependent starch-binding outer membrane protein SusC
MKKLTTLLSLFVFCGLFTLHAQNVQISGTVTSAEDGLTLPGVSVIVSGTTIGTVTDFDGRYSLSVPANANALLFSFIGFETQEVAIAGRTTINVQLLTSIVALDELVVVGYGVQRKREVTGSITSVRGDDIATLAAPSFDTQLAGRSAGVQVTTGSGIIGEAPRIRIRGIGSISSGTQPLMVVDGVPVLTGNVGGYATVNALGDINPNDIESIEILKDGSATAIYGSRAANGVILITTKRGQRGRFNVNYNNWIGVASPIKTFDLTNETQFIELANEMLAANNSPAAANPAGLNTDWQNAVLRQAFQHDHNLNMSGATDQTNYYFSIGYGLQEGVTRPNDMERFTLRANVDQKANDWLSFGVNGSMARTSYNGLNTGENSLSGNIFNAIRQLPNTPIYDAEDPTGYNIDNLNRNLVGPGVNTRTIDDNLPNIMYVLDHNINASQVFRTLANTHAMAQLLPSLTFRTQFGVDMSMTEGHLYWDPLHGDGSTVNGRIYNTQTNYTRWNLQNVLSFNETFGNSHNMGVVLVNEYQHQDYNYFFAGGTDMSGTFWRHNIISNTYTTQLSAGSKTQNSMISYAGRFNYNFDGKYFIQGSLRYDGISSLPEANRWGLFPGGSVGWTLSREAFMENMTFITDLKLRASYAQVGNTSIGNYPYLGLFSAVKYADHAGIAYSQIANPNLQWETSKKTDIGLDATFFDGRYQFSFDYFQNDMDGLILNVPTPASLGVPGNSYSNNIGVLKNWGYEFAGEATIIRTRDFSWSVDANLTFVKNEVSELVDGQPITFAYNRIAEGESIRSLYGYDYQGVNAANGNPIYRKADGSLVQGNIDTQNYRAYDPSNPSDIATAASLVADDRIIFGPTMPTYFGAVSSRLRYGNFDMNVMFRYSGGNYIMNRTRADLTANSFTNYGTEMLGRWQGVENPGDGWTPKMRHGRTNFINLQNNTSGRFVEKGDFLKLQNLTIGYTLPNEVANRIGIERLRIFAQGSELFMITNYTGIDPEMESGGVDFNITPRQRTLTFGVNLSL